MGFYLAPSSAKYFSVIPFCLTYSVCGLLSTGCRVVVPLASGVCPLVGEVGQGACVGFLVGGTGAYVLVGRAGSSPSGGQCHIRGCVLGVCELSTTLGSLSADGWGCVPVLLVVWPETSSTGTCRLLGGAGSWC